MGPPFAAPGDRLRRWLRDLDSSTAVPSPKRRAPLEEMDHNSTPTRVAKRRKNCLDNHDDNDNMAIDATDETPRPAFPPPPLPDRMPSPSRSSHSSHMSSTGGQSRRSQSPVKGLQVLYGALYPLDQRKFDYLSPDPMPELRKMMRDMKQFGTGQSILDPSRMEEYRDSLESEATDVSMACRPRNATAGTQSPALTCINSRIKHVRVAEDRALGEAQRNCSVHSPLMEMACELSTHESSSYWYNVTSAGIRTSLLARLSSGDDLILTRTKKIDFALCLDLKTDDHRRLVRTQPEGLSHFDFAPLSYRPTAVMVETKTPAGDLMEAELQLATHALAQITNLRGLLAQTRSSDRLPPAPLPLLPMLVVHGARWTFYCLEPLAEKAILWCGPDIGDNSTVTGMLQVVTVLQYLQHWAETEYRSWFARNIVHPLLDRGGRR